MKDFRYVVIGGGGGTSMIYPELARTSQQAVAIVSMSDSGGSTGRLSRELGIPPIGDLRNCMMAASNVASVRAMQDYRYGGDGGLRGHSMGNMILAAYVERYGLAEGVRWAGELLQVQGSVLPVTLMPHDLVMQDGAARVVGEAQIDTYPVQSATPRISLEPAVPINGEADEAIRCAELIAIAPGSVYTSLLAACSVEGVCAALAASTAPKVMIANLATEAHQTDGWHVVDYVQALARHGVQVGYVLYNTGEPSEAMLKNYARESQKPVDYSPARFKELQDVMPIGADMIAHAAAVPHPYDAIRRPVMRHDPVKVRQQLEHIAAQHAQRR